MVDDLDLAWEQDEPRRRRGGPASRQQRRRRKDQRRRKGRSYGALIISTLLLLGLGAGVYWGVGQIQENQSIKEFLAADYEPDEMGEEVLFSVPDGASGTVIAVELLEQDIIKSRTAFVQICDSDNRCGAIQPGAYKVNKRSPAQTVFDILVNPDNKQTGQFTVVEGTSVIQTIKAIAEQTGIPLADFEAAIKDPVALGVPADWYVRTDGKPAATTSVEGFLFPDTYFFDPTATATDILKMMVRQFLSVTDEIGFKGAAQAIGLSPYEVLIVASFAQAEGLAVDFAKVARVAYNRAVKDMIECSCLEFDSAANYWLELNGLPTLHSGDMTDEILNDPNNPYNTHADGSKLPLGPIANPGKDALMAAANPAAGDWLFFVTVDTNGTTAFAETYWEHCDNIATAIDNGVNLSYC
jgi:UPF0755 protein